MVKEESRPKIIQSAADLNDDPEEDEETSKDGEAQGISKSQKSGP